MFKIKKTTAQLKKELDEAEKLEKMKTEQAKPAEMIDTMPEAPVPQPTKAEQEAEPEQAKPELSTEQIEQIQENVKYFRENYMGIYTPQDMGCSESDATIASLLFGVLIELKKINDAFDK